MDDNNSINNINQLFFSERNYKKFKHQSGLTVIMNMMPQYNYTYMTIGVKFGSYNIKFKLADNEDYVNVPKGTAHFLEHKMFENKGGEDSFVKFAKTGALANAYTGFNHTVYLCSSSEKINESLKILLETVLDPYFTDNNIKKEIDIINQEIKMYNDDPDWIGYFEVIKGLYSENPIIYDIAGYKNSINQITKYHLYKCYDTFYNLNNMVLSLAGNFNSIEILKTIDEFVNHVSLLPTFINKSYNEPMNANRNKIIIKSQVKIPLLKIGFKFKPDNNHKNNFILSFKYSLLNELLFGLASDFYFDLYYNRILTKPISYEMLHGDDYLATILFIEAQKYNIIEKKILETINNFKFKGFSQYNFDSIKKSFYGRYVMSMDSPEKIATNQMEGFLFDCDFQDWPSIIMNTKKDELLELLRKNYNADTSSISIIIPA